MTSRSKHGDKKFIVPEADCDSVYITNCPPNSRGQLSRHRRSHHQASVPPSRSVSSPKATKRHHPSPSSKTGECIVAASVKLLVVIMDNCGIWTSPVTISVLNSSPLPIPMRSTRSSARFLPRYSSDVSASAPLVLSLSLALTLCHLMAA